MTKKIKIIFSFFIFLSLLQQSSLLFAMEQDENDVVVHIWRSINTTEKWGHASLETKKYHISLWPQGGPRIVMSCPAAILTSLGADIKAKKGKKPDASYSFNSRVLDTEVSSLKINRKFEEFLLYNDISLSDWNKEDQINLHRTRWSHNAAPNDKEKFYISPNSCVAFAWRFLDIGIAEPESFLTTVRDVLNYIPTPLIGNPVEGITTVGQFEEILQNRLKRKYWWPKFS